MIKKKRNSLTDQVIHRLREDIVAGVLPPGTILRDLELAERYDASTSPVREAVQQLAAEGLIEMSTKRPKQVAHMSRKAALDLVAVHRLLASASYEWGAPKVDAAGLKEMREALREISRCVARRDRANVAVATRRFNDVVLRATGNQHLRRLTTMSYSAIERIVVLWNVRGFLYHDNLKAILEFLEAGKPAAAVAHFHKLFDQFQKDVEALAPYL